MAWTLRVLGGRRCVLGAREVGRRRRPELMDTHQRQRVVVSRPVAGHWDRAPATRRTRRRLRQRPARRCSQARQASRANSTERPSIALIASSSCPTRFPVTGGGLTSPSALPGRSAGKACGERRLSRTRVRLFSSMVAAASVADFSPAPPSSRFWSAITPSLTFEYLRTRP